MSDTETESESGNSLQEGEYSPRNAAFGKGAIRAYLRSKPRDSLRWHCGELARQWKEGIKQPVGTVNLEVESKFVLGRFLVDCFIVLINFLAASVVEGMVCCIFRKATILARLPHCSCSSMDQVAVPRKPFRCWESTRIKSI